MYCGHEMLSPFRTTAHVKVSFMLESEATSAFLAARVSEGGCNVAKASGVFFWAAAQGYWNVTTDLGKM